MLSIKRNSEVISLCQDLLKIRSYSGEEGDLVERLKAAFTQMDFDDYSIDEYGSIIGHIKGNRPGPAILFDGHMDTVAVPDPDKWTFDPFGGELVEGRIYGRGASDMKGALCAMVCAAGYLAHDLKRDFAGDIYVAGVVHEECFEGIASRKISQRVKPDYVVIGEASQLNLKIGQRGRAEVVVETFGRTAHSANPEKGVNAVYKMTRLIEKINALQKQVQEPLGVGIFELTDIISSPYPGSSVVPDHCRVTYDRRLLVGETRDSVLQPMNQIIAEMGKEDPDFKAKASFALGQENCYTGGLIAGERFFPAWLYKENDDFVQKALSGLKKAGLNPELTYYSFCTNGSHYAGEAGINTIGFGPSLENLAHTVDEYIEIEQLIKAVEGYYAIAEAVLK